MHSTDIIDSETALESLYGQVNPNSLAKETAVLTPEYRQWIELSPFMAIASIGAGGLDCSPRGDVVGQLFRVIDEKTIAIPDRRGNNRLDTLRNLVVDPRVSLLFLLPGINECIRINGTAKVVTDSSLLRSFAVNGKEPVTVIVVHIGTVYFQCARALLRSSLWSTDKLLNKSSVPTAGQMAKGAVNEFDAEAYDADLPMRQRTTLY